MEFGVVVVTYNRLDKLKKALDSYENQTFLPSYILVIDNHCTDGTTEYLETWKNTGKVKKYVYTLEQNTGGSGGFYHGFQYAINLDAQWIWVADDDAYAEKDCFLYAHNFLLEHKNENISAICSTVEANGEIVLECRRRIHRKLLSISQRDVTEEEYRKDYFECDLLTYAGGIINKEKILEVGLTEKDYFIYYDDTEHSYRLSKVGKIYCIPKMILVHDVPKIDNNIKTVSWKEFYKIRNYLNFLKKHFGKRYYYVAYIKYYFKNKIKTIIRYWPEKARLEKQALLSAKQNKLGIHNVYKPGWKATHEKH